MNKTFLKTGEVHSSGLSRANHLNGCVTTMDKKQITKLLAFMSMSDGCLTMHKGCVNAEE
jgi:hypothetical protein